jgi:hypothetical protein
MDGVAIGGFSMTPAVEDEEQGGLICSHDELLLLGKAAIIRESAVLL